MTDTLQDLIARLEKAETADREIDCAIAISVLGYWLQDRGHGVTEYCRKDAEGNTSCGTSVVMVRPYTASLDAAVGLVERVLPGWGVYFRRDKDGCGGGLTYPEYTFVCHHAVAATLPLTICLALLRALSSQQGGE